MLVVVVTATFVGNDANSPNVVGDFFHQAAFRVEGLSTLQDRFSLGAKLKLRPDIELNLPDHRDRVHTGIQKFGQRLWELSNLRLMPGYLVQT